jgi:hypothetical protein
MNNLSQFINKDNLDLLWEVLLDELSINKTNTNLISKIKTIFDTNINLLTSKTNSKTNILDINKQFLSQVLLAVNQLIPQLNQEQNIKRINISDEEVLEPYKIEDIQAARKTDFEKELEMKKLELENYMTPSKPRELDFSDRNLDGIIPLEGMDSLLAEKMAERNLDMEQISNAKNINPEQWLTPKKTSVKQNNVEETKNLVNGRLKYINIDNDNNINIINNAETNKIQKKVSWDNNVSTNENQNISLKIDDSTIDIFKKLKKNNVENIQNQYIDNSKYEEQKSIPLPTQENVLKNNTQITKPIITNNPIVSNNEIVKQLNEMNSKIDKLYEIVFKLSNKLKDIIEKNIDEDY